MQAYARFRFLPMEVVQAHPAGKMPRSRWRGYISALAWERLGIPQLELADVAGKGKSGALSAETAASVTQPQISC